MKFGLIGFPVGHSFSRDYFIQKFQSEGRTSFTYDLLELKAIEEVIPILHNGYMGLNVTIPYKSAILRYINDIDPDALHIGAVNTLVRSGLNSWKGFNTDVIGFRESLLQWFAGVPLPTHALVLGTGGAAKAVLFVLGQLGIHATMVSRSMTGTLKYEDLDQAIIQQHTLIINTTPLGMMPDVQTCPPIPFAYITSSHWLFDLVYNPVNTLFLTRGAQNGARTQNGLGMLHLQADHAWTIWKSYGKF